MQCNKINVAEPYVNNLLKRSSNWFFFFLKDRHLLTKALGIVRLCIMRSELAVVLSGRLAGLNNTFCMPSVFPSSPTGLLITVICGLFIQFLYKHFFPQCLLQGLANYLLSLSWQSLVLYGVLLYLCSAFGLLFVLVCLRNVFGYCNIHFTLIITNWLYDYLGYVNGVILIKNGQLYRFFLTVSFPLNCLVVKCWCIYSTNK